MHISCSTALCSCKFVTAERSILLLVFTQDLIVMLCMTIGEYMPKFVIEKIVYEFLRYDNWECATLGLRALLELLLMAAEKSRGTKSKNVGFTPRMRQQLVTLEVHDLEAEVWIMPAFFPGFFVCSVQ